MFVDRMLLELAALGHRDLTRAHMKIFPVLNPQGVRVTQMAEQLQTSKQALSKLIDDLERLGYLTRIPDEGDGRAKIVMLTASGQALIQDGASVRDKLETECLAALPEQDRPRIHAALAQLAKALAASGTR
jgi:DNA-binding MarR family transcriptional regulator